MQKIIWQEPTEVVFDDGLVVSPELLEALEDRLRYIESSQKQIIDFLKAELLEPVMILVNNEMAKNGKFELPDHQEVKEPITEQQIREAICLQDLYIYKEKEGLLISMNLTLDPDYIWYHFTSVDVRPDNTLVFGGING